MKYKCPICKQYIKPQFIGFGNIMHCDNNCFGNLPKKFATCPVCKKGLLRNPIMHANSEYAQCDNCKFEIKLWDLISILV